MASRVVGWALVVLIFTSLIPFGFLDAIIPVQAGTNLAVSNPAAESMAHINPVAMASSNTSDIQLDDTPATEPESLPQQILTCLGSIMTFMMLVIFFSDFRTTKS